MSLKKAGAVRRGNSDRTWEFVIIWRIERASHAVVDKVDAIRDQVGAGHAASSAIVTQMGQVEDLSHQAKASAERTRRRADSVHALSAHMAGIVNRFEIGARVEVRS